MRLNLPGKLDPAQLRHALKTALAAVITYLFTLWIDAPQGALAVISVIIVMQGNLGESLQAGWVRFVGAGVGAGLGVLSLLTLGSGVLGLGVGVALTMLVCAYFVALHESFRVAGLTASLVILAGGHSQEFLTSAAILVGQISLGVAVGLGVTWLVWPSRAGRALKQGVVEALRMEARLLRLLTDRKTPASGLWVCLTRLETARARNHKLLDAAKKEPAGLSKGGHIVVSLSNFVDRIAEDLTAMEHTGRRADLDELHAMLGNVLDDLTQNAIAVMERLADSLEHNQDPPSVDNLADALMAAEDRFQDLRGRGTFLGSDMEAVMGFFAFFHHVRDVALELSGMVSRAAML